MHVLELIPIVVAVLLSVCAFAIFLSVAISFFEDKTTHAVKKNKKSIVETGTMTVFFIVYYLVVKNSIGYSEPFSVYLKIIMSIIGLSLIVVGTYVNVRGRYELGQNWANQIKIYTDHRLLTTGMYSLVRHPLYASLIWIFFGGSVLFSNWVAFLLTALLFVPFMYYRAKQEEQLLSESFKSAYTHYVAQVPMFFPKGTK